MKILLIEDDPHFTEFLSSSLRRDGHVIETAADGRDGLDLFLQDAHDLVLLDRMLPTMNGLFVLKCARTQGIKTPVILLTALGELYDKVEGLDAGADDYLVKPFSYEELSARIRSVGRRYGSFSDDGYLSFSDLSYDTLQRILSGPGGALPLSGREGALLECFFKNPDETLRRMTLLYRVWGTDAAVEEGNLDTYIHFLRKRLLYVKSDVTIETVRGIGYRMTAKRDAI